MPQGEVLQFQNPAIAESAGENRDDGTHDLKHAGETTAARHKTLDFSWHSEFLVATRPNFRSRALLVEAEPGVEHSDKIVSNTSFVSMGSGISQ